VNNELTEQPSSLASFCLLLERSTSFQDSVSKFWRLFTRRTDFSVERECLLEHSEAIHYLFFPALS